MPAGFDSSTWSEQMISLLDDHHLVILSDSTSQRSTAGRLLQHRLGMLPETEVIDIDGTAALDMASFCQQIMAAARNRLGDSNGNGNAYLQRLIAHLRMLRRKTKRRYVIWHDADAMLEQDVATFSVLVNALLAVAAEHEHTTRSPLLLQRAVFIGGAKLGAYAEDIHGQFCCWLDDADDAPFWDVLSAVDRPRVIVYRMEG